MKTGVAPSSRHFFTQIVPLGVMSPLAIFEAAHEKLRTALASAGDRPLVAPGQHHPEHSPTPPRRLRPAPPGTGRWAHLSQPKAIHLQQGRGRCQARNLCMRGCPFGAYFSSNSATLVSPVVVISSMPPPWCRADWYFRYSA